MISVKSDFNEKMDEANILLDHLDKVSKESHSVVKSAILKSSYVILLYNIIESTTRLTFEVIHDSISLYQYEQFSSEIKSLYVNYYFTKQSSKNHKENLDNVLLKELKFPLIEIYTKKITLFSGNLDARELNKLTKKYGIKPITNRNKKHLLDIKSKRNKLAHGEESFKDSCRGYSIEELATFGKSVNSSMTQLIDKTEVYLNGKNYLIEAYRL